MHAWHAHLTYDLHGLIRLCLSRNTCVASWITTAFISTNACRIGFYTEIIAPVDSRFFIGTQITSKSLKYTNTNSSTGPIPRRRKMEPRNHAHGRILPKDPIWHNPHNLVQTSSHCWVQAPSLLLLPHLQDQWEEGSAGNHGALQQLCHVHHSGDKLEGTALDQ